MGPTRHCKALGLASKARCCSDHNKLENHKNHCDENHKKIKTLSDPGHWEKKCWMTLYTKKFLPPMDYGANDENTLKMGVRQNSPMEPVPRNQNVLRE